MMFRDLTPAMKDALDRHITGNWGEDLFSGCYDLEWLSACCGATPHESTPDIDEDNQAGICSQCGKHTGFELMEV